MNPHFSVGPITVYYYGLILAVAILAAFVYARRRSARFGVPPTFIDTALLAMVPTGIVGARLYFVAFSWEYFKTRPSEIFALQDGGLAIHGALVGGALGLAAVWWFYNRRTKPATSRISFVSLLDLFAPVLPLAQAIGRLANYVNREAFGTPTDLPWGIAIPTQQRPPQYATAEYFHPTFAYEALWNLVGLALLLLMEKRFKKIGRPTRGLLFAVYLGWYSLGRFWIEALRTDALLVGSSRIAQIVSIMGVLGSAGFIWYRLAQWRAHQRPTKASSSTR